MNKNFLETGKLYEYFKTICNQHIYNFDPNDGHNEPQQEDKVIKEIKTGNIIFVIEKSIGAYEAYKILLEDVVGYIILKNTEQYYKEVF